MIIIGLDEVGRGCWAGPLVAAAVVLDPLRPVPGLNDSKKLRPSAREELAALVHERALAVGIGWMSPQEIDMSGITTAVKRVMEQAYEEVVVQLGARCVLDATDIIIDGNYNFLPGVAAARTLVGADGLEPAVSAASIVAKVARDEYMQAEAHAAYPVYGFDKHVGYGTALHQAALAAHGVTPMHRRSFKPIQALLVQSDA